MSEGDGAVTPGPFLTDAGSQTANELLGPAGSQQLEANAQRWAKRVDENWAHTITDFIINGMYSRGVLPTDTRELCVVAALTVLGRVEELESHIRIALVSNPPELVREVIIQMAVYGGVPVTLEAMRIYEHVLEDSP